MPERERVILHCDLNNFFASVETLAHPELAGVPMAVGGSTENRHGIILAKNELAKRFGVTTAETIWQAKQKCPGLIVVPPHMDRYVEMSRRARSIYTDYTDRVEPFGMDEAWLDVTGSRLLFGEGRSIADAIRERMKRELHLTISVGVSFCKVFAKLGSDLKKPDAVTEIPRERWREIVHPLPAGSLLGIGQSTADRLAKYGIHTIGGIADAGEEFLRQTLGKVGGDLWRAASGLERSPVARYDAAADVKSIGNSMTCASDLQTDEEVYRTLLLLAESVAARLREQELLAGSIQISVKENDLSVREAQSPLPFATRRPKDLADAGMALVRKRFHWERPVRALGVRAFHLMREDESIQCSLLLDEARILRLDALEGKICSLRERYGDRAVQRASLLQSSIRRAEQLSGRASGAAINRRHM